MEFDEEDQEYQAKDETEQENDSNDESNEESTPNKATALHNKVMMDIFGEVLSDDEDIPAQTVEKLGKKQIHVRCELIVVFNIESVATLMKKLLNRAKRV